ncbi:MAG TPA: rhamnulose-1-phosphate aldolase, partial [Anaerolineales bacterium]|nr:rhamnulose-1-phosphate aldolase [Anaerolineales bacterium]
MADHTALELDTILYHLGQAGSRLAEIGAAEGAAGNISVCLRQPLDVGAQFPQTQEIELPHAAPELAGMMLVVSGSGRRLREIAESPLGNLACVLIHPGGRR